MNVGTERGTSEAAVALAKKVLSSTGAQECTFSVTDTGDEQYGAIAAFKAAGGAGPIIPVFMNQYRQRRN